MDGPWPAATCHTGGQNVIESDKTLERDALVEYLDGGFSTASIERQVQWAVIILMQNSAVPFLQFKDLNLQLKEQPN